MPVQSQKITSSMLLISLILLLLAEPIFLGFKHLGAVVMFNFLAQDTMYYSLIANNYVKYGFPTGDGQTVSNGFQPLWGFFLMAVFKIFRIDLAYQLQTIFALSIFFIAGAYSFIALSLQKLFGTKSAVLGLVTLFPGIYFLVFEPPKSGSPDPAFLYTLNPWSAINGMETPLMLCLYGFLIYLVVSQCLLLRQSNQSLTLTNLIRWPARVCLLLIVFCRLEQIFFLVAITLVTLTPFFAGRLSEKIAQLIEVFWPTVLALIVFMVLNQVLVGAPLPTSGSGKIGISLMGNLGLLWSYFKSHGGDQQDRIAALLFCIGIGALFFLIGLRKIKRESNPSDPQHYLVAGTLLVGLFLLLNAVFLFTLVPLWNQGYWYYFPMIFTAAFVFACYIALAGKHFQVTGYLLGVFILILALNMSAINRLATQPPTKYALVTSILWKQQDRIAALLESQFGKFKIIDTYDGAFAYLLNVPTRSITGLVASPAEAAKGIADFWGNAIKDGFNVVPLAENAYILPNFAEENHLRIINKIKPDGVPIEFFLVEKNPSGQSK
jgi:hypothetical protein